MDENKTEKLSILAAFSSNDNIPILLGMKDLLAKYSSLIDIKNLTYEIEINWLGLIEVGDLSHESDFTKNPSIAWDFIFIINNSILAYICMR